MTGTLVRQDPLDRRVLLVRWAHQARPGMTVQSVRWARLARLAQQARWAPRVPPVTKEKRDLRVPLVQPD